MVMHKRIRLTPLDRLEIWRLWQTGHWKVLRLAEHDRVSRPTIYKVLARARKQEFVPRRRVNPHFKALKFGLKRLAKVEDALEEQRKREARHYNKSYPGELVHFDTKRLPLLKGEESTRPGEYLFVAVDDFSRELYAGIYPDKTQYSAAAFLRQALTGLSESFFRGKESYDVESLEHERDRLYQKVGQLQVEVDWLKSNWIA